MSQFCIEDAEIKDNHRDSAVARWLEEQGFRDERPEDTWHRVGPWIFACTDTMTYRYCPHWAVGCGSVFEDVNFTFGEFRAIWASVASARDRKKRLPNWEDRIKVGDAD